jgi:hypothetical protein
MTKERWKQLFESMSEKPTPEENAMGWHFCDDYDGLLVGPPMSEWHTCNCITDEGRKEAEEKCVAAGWAVAPDEYTEPEFP